MRRTVPSLLRDRPPKEKDLLIWAQEVIPAVKEMQSVNNREYSAEFTHTTTLTAAFETAWTSDTVPGDASWRVFCEIQARATDGSSAWYWIYGGFKRVSSAALAQVGSTVALITPIEDVAGWDVQFTTSGNTVLAQVKGDAARTVDWWLTPYVLERVIP